MNGLLERLRRRRARVAEPELVDDGTLVVLVESWDPAVADSDVLATLRARGGSTDGPVLVRHHFLLPDESALDQARSILRDESYAVEGEAGPDGWRVLAVRPERLDAMTLAQQRTRMAGLAARLGGDVLGWDALGPEERR